MSSLIFDTNIILDGRFDPESINSDIFIPMVVVEELDRHKTSSAAKGRYARRFVSWLDSLCRDAESTRDIFADGTYFNEKNKISIGGHWPGKPADDQIIEYAIALKSDCNDIVLKTNDTILRMRARGFGIVAEGGIPERKEIYPGVRVVENLSPDIICELYDQGAIKPELLDFDLIKNEGLVLKGAGGGSALAFFNYKSGMVQLLNTSRSFFGILPKNTKQHFALSLLANPEIPLVTLVGKAGTGKTLLALAGAMSVKDKYKQILIARPNTPLDNKDIGFLPGSVDEKIGPYLQPFFDNMGILRGDGKNARPIKEYVEEKKIEAMPLAYIRGRSLNRRFIIIDEAQNLNEHEIKTILTRLGTRSKIVFTGDIDQIDIPGLSRRTSGLSKTCQYMFNDEYYGHVTLDRIERNKAIEHFLNRFDPEKERA